jgi:hypothetical protein
MNKKSARIGSLKKLTCSDSLKRLSDSNLLERLEKIRGTERAVQHRVVLCLAEVERRKLYLPRGYGSLFEFCTDYLKYSRSSAARRWPGASRGSPGWRSCPGGVSVISRCFRRSPGS